MTGRVRNLYLSFSLIALLLILIAFLMASLRSTPEKEIDPGQEEYTGSELNTDPSTQQ